MYMLADREVPKIGGVGKENCSVHLYYIEQRGGIEIFIILY